MSRRPILVTGGSGLLGRSLAALTTPVRPVIAISRAGLDIADPGAIARALDVHEPEVVVNAAAMTDVDGCERDPEAARRANADGPGRLAEECSRSGVRLVHVSTDFVFDGRKREPYTIDDYPNPLSVYGVTKLAGERAVLEASPDAVIARTSWVFGPGGRNFASRILDYAASANRLEGIVDMRSLPTYAPDLATRILELAEIGTSGTFHLTGSGEPATWFDVARAILVAARRTGVELVPVTTAQLGLPAPRPPYSAMKCLRSKALGLEPMRRWNDAVEAFVTVVGSVAARSPK